ncbi:NUDIX hydrolase domain protein [Rutstroemia sp. NJR-2017a BVV2]|nr:NUDIX hydrolase domain protein [Rutstroemia sp. NJR-2017a BVV2]
MASPTSTSTSAPKPSLPPSPTVRVGVGVFILRTNPSSAISAAQTQFLIGLRKGSHGANTWGLPGGHLEFGESFEECAEREVKEETGLTVTETQFLTATNDVMEEDGKHYVTVFMVCRCRKGEEEETRVLEPEKCERWEWMGWEDIVSGVKKGSDVGGKQGARFFSPLVNLVRQRPEVGARLT